MARHKVVGKVLGRYVVLKQAVVDLSPLGEQSRDVHSPTGRRQARHGAGVRCLGNIGYLAMQPLLDTIRT